MPVTKRHSWAEARTSFRQQQRHAIALAAIELLLEGGSAELTMSMVAERAGISRQTLYRYFPDLGSVLAASTEGFEHADEAMRLWVLEVENPREQMHRVVDALVDAAESHSGSTEEFLAALPPEARGAVRAHHERTVDLLAHVLTRLHEEASVAYCGDPEVDGPLFLGLISAARESNRERTHQLIDQLIT